MGWEGSTRKQRLPPDWQRRRATVLRRDRFCMLRTHCNGAPATEVDHRTAGDDHSLGNLQGACHTCHAAKSAREGVDARNARRTRPAEEHPGATR